MSLADIFASELQFEAISTRRVLDRLPESEFGWKPHTKSMDLGRLASHVAEIPSYMATCIGPDELLMDPANYKPWIAKSTADLLQKFDESVSQALANLRGVTDEQLSKMWTLKMGDKPVWTAPKSVVVRNFVLNHLIHHRAQLSVYMRLKDIPVPSIYGPSADEGLPG